jgi:hypothetical protein
MRHHERKRMMLHRGIRAIKSGGIKHHGDTHGTFNSVEMFS